MLAEIEGVYIHEQIRCFTWLARHLGRGTWLGISFTWVGAQDIQTFIPFWGSPIEQQEINAAEVDTAGGDAAGSDAVEIDTEVLLAKIEAGEIDFADTDLIPLTPLPAGREGPSKPTEQDIEELKEFAKNEPPKEEVIVYVGGPETKGQEILWSKGKQSRKGAVTPLMHGVQDT